MSVVKFSFIQLIKHEEEKMTSRNESTLQPPKQRTEAEEKDYQEKLKDMIEGGFERRYVDGEVRVGVGGIEKGPSKSDIDTEKFYNGNIEP